MFKALALWLGLVWAGASWPTCAAAQPLREAAAQSAASDPATRMADWVARSGDNRGLPFAIVDKVGARVFVYNADAQLIGVAPALLGFARGDHSTPGVGDRELSDIPPEERTTPAGRFFAGYGPALGGKKVLWVDYATAISLHQVVTAKPKERRLQRLKSATPKDNRITFGCINVSAQFYRKVVRPTFKAKNGVIYVLPETQPLEKVFPALASPGHVRPVVRDEVAGLR